MLPHLKKPSAIFFDWDGTLVDSLAFLTAAHNHVKKIYDLPMFNGREYHEYLGMQRDQIFKEIYGANSESAKKEFENYYYKEHLQGLVVFDGVEEMLDFIKSIHIPMGIVSNKKGDFLRAEVMHLGWGKYFGNCIVGAGDAKSDKPDPAPLIHALNIKNPSLNLTEIWYVGDTVIDALCAYKSDCQAIILEDKNHDANSKLQKEIKAAKITKNTVYIKNYEEICGFLLH